jgi:hypothetical protein
MDVEWLFEGVFVLSHDDGSTVSNVGREYPFTLHQNGRARTSAKPDVYPLVRELSIRVGKGPLNQVAHFPLGDIVTVESHFLSHEGFKPMRQSCFQESRNFVAVLPMSIANPEKMRVFQLSYVVTCDVGVLVCLKWISQRDSSFCRVGKLSDHIVMPLFLGTLDPLAR